MLCPALSQAAIVVSEDFSSGTLSGGTGWLAGSWTALRTSPVAPVVSSVNPLTPGSGNYLPVVANTTQQQTHGVSRTIPTVVATNAHTITFDWRLDTSLTDFASWTDRVHFGASNGDVNSTPNFSWLVGVAAASNSTANVVPAGKWYVYDHDGDSDFTGANLINTGVDLVAGVTYSFTIQVNPAGTGTYTVSFIGSNGTSYNSGTLDFRNQNSAVANQIVFASVTSATDDGTTFSFDNFAIDGVPEPSAALLVGISGLAVLARRRRD